MVTGIEVIGLAYVFTYVCQAAKKSNRSESEAEIGCEPALICFKTLPRFAFLRGSPLENRPIRFKKFVVWLRLGNHLEFKTSFCRDRSKIIGAKKTLGPNGRRRMPG